MTKATWGRKWLGFFFNLHFIVQYEVSQNRKLGLEPGGRNGSRGLCGVLLTGSLSMDCLTCFFIQPGSNAQGWHYAQWAEPSHINQENDPGLCMGQSERNRLLFFFNWGFPFLDVWLYLLSVTVKKKFTCFINPKHSQSLREIRTGTKAGQEPVSRNLSGDHGGMLFKGSFFMAFSACFLNYQNHVPKGGIAHTGSDSYTAVINEDNDPQTCLQVSLLEAFSQSRFPLLRWL